MIKLSHTAKNLYLKCPMAYYMHYVLNIREEITSSALLFGSNLEHGLEALLRGKTLEEAFKAFEEAHTNVEINGKMVEAPTSKLIRYSKSDTKDGLSDTPWESMLIKGKMLIEEYQNLVLPEIKDVLALQEPIKIKNSHGDIIRGFADMIIEDVNGDICLMDNKTSASKYAENAVTKGDKAKQLAIYDFALKNKFKLTKGGFYVLEKQIRKRDPKARIQILKDKVNQDLVNETLQEFDDVLYNIRMGVFTSNTPNCNSYYGNCICQKYVESGGNDMTGLIVKEKKNG